MGSFASSPPVINFVHWRSGAGEQLRQGRADGISSLPFPELLLESLQSSSTEIPRDRTAHGPHEVLCREGLASFAALKGSGRAGQEKLWMQELRALRSSGKLHQAEHPELHRDVEMDQRAKTCQGRQGRNHR